MYSYERIPNRTHGFNFAQLTIIADTILKEVNTAGADLMLNTRHRKDAIQTRWDCRARKWYKTIRAGYQEYVTPWETENKRPDFSGQVETVPSTIKIRINNFKMEVVKSPYAIRKLFNKLNIKIVEI